MGGPRPPRPPQFRTPWLLKVFKLFGGGNLYRGHIILLTHLRDSNIETSTTLNEILIFIGFPFDIKYFNFFCRLHTTGN